MSPALRKVDCPGENVWKHPGFTRVPTSVRLVVDLADPGLGGAAVRCAVLSAAEDAGFGV